MTNFKHTGHRCGFPGTIQMLGVNVCRGAVISQHTQHLAELNLCVSTHIGSLTVKSKSFRGNNNGMFSFQKTPLVLLEELGSVLLQSVSA